MSDPRLDVDAVARGLAELEFDARVALPEAQERFKRAEAERDRAIETRENANAVSVRVEAENRRLREDYRALLCAHPDVQLRALQAYLASSVDGQRTIDAAREEIANHAVGKPDARDVARGEELAREHGWQ